MLFFLSKIIAFANQVTVQVVSMEEMEKHYKYHTSFYPADKRLKKVPSKPFLPYPMRRKTPYTLPENHSIYSFLRTFTWNTIYSPVNYMNYIYDFCALKKTEMAFKYRLMGNIYTLLYEHKIPPLRTICHPEFTSILNLRQTDCQIITTAFEYAKDFFFSIRNKKYDNSKAKLQTYLSGITLSRNIEKLDLLLAGSRQITTSCSLLYGSTFMRDEIVPSIFPMVDSPFLQMYERSNPSDFPKRIPEIFTSKNSSPVDAFMIYHRRVLGLGIYELELEKRRLELEKLQKDLSCRENQQKYFDQYKRLMEEVERERQSDSFDMEDDSGLESVDDIKLSTKYFPGENDVQFQNYNNFDCSQEISSKLEGAEDSESSGFGSFEDESDCSSIFSDFDKGSKDRQDCPVQNVEFVLNQN